MDSITGAMILMVGEVALEIAAGGVAGALLGGVAIMMIGRGIKGRDFIGVAVAFFFMATIVGALIIPAAMLAQNQLAAAGNFAAYDFMPVATGVVTFCVAFVPGVIFVLLANPANRAD